MCSIFKIVVVFFLLHIELNGMSSKPIIEQIRGNVNVGKVAGKFGNKSSVEFDKRNNLISDAKNNSLTKVTKSKNILHSFFLAMPEASQSGQLNDSGITVHNDSGIGSSISNIDLFYALNNTLQTENEEIPDANEFNLDPDENDLQKFLVNYDTDNGNLCLLDHIKDELLWWSYPNGTLRIIDMQQSKTSYLDLSYKNMTQDEDVLGKILMTTKYSHNVVVFSAAFNSLSMAPYQTLWSMRKSLKFLTLRGNRFAAFTADMEGKGVAWATFPVLPELLELDLTNCSIEYVTIEAFRNFTNLRRLFMSQNKMVTIPYDTFYYVQKIQYLDLSFTNVLTHNYQWSLPTLEVVLNLIYGLKIQTTTFKFLPELIYLDMSHTKITRNSAMAFTHLADKLKYLSLCYTAFPMVGNALFKNTVLEGLDLSGNPFVSYNIMDDAFEGIADTLKYLYFEYSNLKDISWLKYLKKLRVLGLAGNNINSVTTDTFMLLKSLQILDLSSNHIGNWYKRAFSGNSELRVLNVRDNNINMITTEMLKDFELLDYLSLGDNNFLCDCLLRELVDVAAGNNKDPDCAHEFLHLTQKLISNETATLFETEYFSRLTSNVTLTNWFSNQNPSINTINIHRALWTRYAPVLAESYNNIKDYSNQNKIFNLRFLKNMYRGASMCSKSINIHNDERLNGTALKFQLLDYEEEHYWCYNQTEQLQVGDLNCQRLSFEDEITSELHTITNVVLAVVGSLVGLFIVGTIIYLKRWHIHYYYSSLKTAALLSVASKESIDNFENLAKRDPNMVYDIFISYCQNDRQWVLDELLPNVEDSGEISICLHERDFKIGVTILDNIISCMDRSRALMLIISSKFLLSHWCQFEMYLAQHRIFEASKEHLLLVFLEDIPRRKRPKTLQYLMDVKTYIRWPVAKGNKPAKPEERKLFWKRLKRSLETTANINMSESRA